MLMKFPLSLLLEANIEVKKCIRDKEDGEPCDQYCEALPCSTFIPASEWYCPVCHTSYPMDAKVAGSLINYEKKMMSNNRGGG